MYLINHVTLAMSFFLKQNRLFMRFLNADYRAVARLLSTATKVTHFCKLFTLVGKQFGFLRYYKKTPVMSA